MEKSKFSWLLSMKMSTPTPCITSMNTTLFNKNLSSRKTIKFKISRNEDLMTFLGTSFQRLKHILLKILRQFVRL